MNGMPVIRLEIEGMKHTIMHAMTQHLAQMDADIQAVVENLCTPARILEVITTTAQKEIDQVVKAEVERFYRYGKGQEAVKQAVARALERNKYE